MPSLQISALGSPEIRLNNERVAVKPKKVLALLVYLAAVEHAQSRDALATLFWPESGQRQARAALRRRLSELAHAIGDRWLQADGETLRLAAEGGLSYDVRRFEEAIDACQGHGHTRDEVCPECRQALETAAALYRNDFLAGFSLADCPEFDDWQFFQAESLRQELASVLERLALLYEVQGDPAAAIPCARRWIALDPLHEAAHRALMRAYFDAGQRSAALRQYELCAQTLEAELGVSPDAETMALCNAIRSGAAAAPAAGRVVRLAPDAGQTHADEIYLDEATVTQDEVRMASVLALDVDVEDEEDWDRRPDEVSARIAGFLQASVGLMDRYAASVLHTHDSGFQAAFGLPELHEDDAERAVRVAFALKEKAAGTGLVMTAGVATGMVYVTYAKANTLASVTGPSVNLAARLLGQARRGSVLVDATTHYQTEQAARFVPHAVAGRGRAEALTVFEAVRPRRHAVKSRGIGSLRAPLIGRDEEMAKLQAALDKARHGSGQVVTVVGEAGLGKSRLVAELQAIAGGVDMRDDVLWLEGRCLEMMQPVAYWPFVDILQTGFGWMPHTPEAERAQQVASTLDALRLEQRLTDEQVDVMGPILGRLLSLRYGNEWDGRLQNARPEQVRHQSFQTLRDFAVATALRQPTVLVLEDLHWADALSLDLVGYLLETLTDVPLLLLCVYRPESALEQDRLAAVASRKCPAAYTEIRLRELTPDLSRALVEALLHVEGLTPPTRNRILDACQGNPFFLEEVIHDLIESAVIYRDGNVWRARQEIDATPVPARVQGVVLARYDRLEPVHKVVLQHAAVIGRLFSEQVLASALAQDIDMDETLDALEARAFIYPERIVPEPVYSFRHVLVQEAIYRTLPSRRLAALHGRVAGALESLYAEGLDAVVDQIAHHYDRSDATEKAIEYLLRAGDRAARAYMTDEAVAHYEHALQRIDELDGDGPSGEEHMRAWRFHALGELGKTLMRSSRYDDAETYLRQAIAYGKEHGLPVKEVVRLHWWLGDLLMNWNVRYGETLQTGLDGLALLPEEERESVEAAMMYGIVAFGYYFIPDRKRHQEITDHLAGFVRNVPYCEELRVCYGSILDACCERRAIDEVVEWLAYAEEQARLHHADWALAEHTWVRAYTLWFGGGDPKETIATMRHSRSLMERVGDAKRANWADVGLGEILGEYGLAREAEAVLHSAMPAVRALNEEHLVDALLTLASAYITQRKWPEAEEALQEARREMEERTQNPAEALVLLGFVALANDHVDEAIDRFREALNLLDDPDRLPHRWRKWYLLVNSFFANALYGLERALDNADAFHAFCRDFRNKHPATDMAVFRHWRLTPAVSTNLPGIQMLADRFACSLGNGWKWVDPHGGCEFEVDQGFTICSPVARDLVFPLLNAPRVMRPAAGDFATQVTCAPARADRPGIGGILLWQDAHNFLRVCIGVRAQDEMSLEGCIDDKDVVIGRGRLVGEPVTLRMERIGEWVRALCSADSVTWYSVGEIEFPPVEHEDVGLVAIGFPDRTIYHAPYADGTAIRFTDFRLWN